MVLLSRLGCDTR